MQKNTENQTIDYMVNNYMENKSIGNNLGVCPKCRTEVRMIELDEIYVEMFTKDNNGYYFELNKKGRLKRPFFIRL